MELLPGVGCPDLYLAIYQRKSRNPHGRLLPSAQASGLGKALCAIAKELGDCLENEEHNAKDNREKVK